MTTHLESILWRRLDVPGHDACRLVRTAGGHRLEGTAVFAQEGRPAQLRYSLSCDRGWGTVEATVCGWIGERPFDLAIRRTGEGWLIGGAPAEGLSACVDLDLAFTPASNLLQLRRIALADGQEREVPVAWLEVGSAALEVLVQRYQRRGERAYWYEAPRFGYAALLETTAAGFVSRYPGLWEAEPADGN